MKAFLTVILLSMMYPGKRQVLIFYSAAGEQTKTEQLAVLNREKRGLQERNLEIAAYKSDAAKQEAQRWNVSASSAFTFILVGKDGGEKLRCDTVVSAEQLFATIDAMPMRREEMKEQNK